MSDELMEKVILKEEMPRYELFILKKGLEELKAGMDACTTSCNSKRALGKKHMDILINTQNELNQKRYTMRSEGRWKEGINEVIERFKGLQKSIPSGFTVKEISEGVSPFVIFLIPQTHANTSGGEYRPNAIKSQNAITELAVWLKNNKFSNVILWEGKAKGVRPSYTSHHSHDSEDTHSSQRQMKQRADHRDYFHFNIESDPSTHDFNTNLEFFSRSQAVQIIRKKIIGKAINDEPISVADIKEVKEEILSIPGLSSGFLEKEFPEILTGDNIKSDTIISMLERALAIISSGDKSINEDSPKRNIIIGANILMLQENLGANGMSLVLGENHFKKDGASNMQEVLRNQGISFVLLEPSN